MSASDGRVIIDTQVNTQGARRGLLDIQSLMERLGGVAKKIGKFLKDTFSIQNIVKFAQECIDLGSDLAEVQNVVDSTFTTMSKKVDEFATSALQMYGLSETMAKQFTGSFGAMAKSFGFTEQQAFDMSTTLAGLAGDVASFYNIDQEAAYGKLKAVFSGETESLKDLGIVMTQSALDSYAMANGFGKTTDKMTEQEKVALRYKFVIDQLSTASGDFQRTSGGWANQVRILKLQFDSLKATIGQGLINLLLPVVKVINIVLGKLATLANAFKSLTELITGNKSSGQTDAGAAGLGMGDMQAAADDTNAVADAANDAADATEDLADAQDDNAAATKNARKEQERFLAGFDKITKLSDNSDDGSSSSPSAGKKKKKDDGKTGGPVSIEPVNYGEVAKGETELEKMGGIFDKVIAKAKEMAKLFSIGFRLGFGDSKKKIQDIVKNLGKIKKSMVEIFTDPKVVKSADRFFGRLSYNLGLIAGSMASIGLTSAQLYVGGIAKFLDQSKERIKQHIVAMFDIGTDIADIAGSFSVAMATILEGFGGENAQGFLGNVLSIVYEVKAVIDEIAGKLLRDVMNIIALPFIENAPELKQAIDDTMGVLETFTGGLLTAVQTLTDAWRGLYDEHLKPFFDSVAKGLSGILNTLITGYNTYVLPVLQGLSEKFTELMEGPFGEAIRNIFAIIGDIIDAITFLWTTVLQPVIDFLGGLVMVVLGSLIDIVGTTLLGAIEGISTFINETFKPAWDTLVTFFQDTFGPKLEELSGKFKTLKEEYLDKIAEFLSGTFSSAWTALKDLWEGPISEGIETIKGALSTFFEEIIKPLGQFIGHAMLEAWTKLKDYWTNDLSPKLAELHAAFQTFKDNVLSPMAKTVRNTLLQAWEKISAFFSGDANESTKTLSDTLKSLWDNVLKPVAEFVSGTLSVAFDTFTTALSGLIEFLTNVFEGDWEGAWNTVVETFGGIWSAIVDYVKTPINAAIGLVNDMINWINDRMKGIAEKIQIPAFTVDIPVIGEVGFDGWKLFDSPPQINTIPELAKGAVIPPNAPFAAILGDQKRGTNIEAPLDTIKQALAEVIADIRAGENRSEGIRTINLMLDGRVISEVVVDDINRQINSTGVVPINI